MDLSDEVCYTVCTQATSRIGGEIEADVKSMVQSLLGGPALIGTPLVPVIKEIMNSEMNEGIEAMMERQAEFSSPDAALLSGVGLEACAREYFDERIDAMWDKPVPRFADEVVIGSGVHAAIYCAVRKQMGAPKPLVLEAKPRAGGIFATSRGPSFYLNSRNRPGSLGIPGEENALNVLPGALVQPADLSCAEFQVNDDLAYVIRTTLATSAVVRTNAQVVSFEGGLWKSGSLLIRVKLANGKTCLAKRVILATGLGVPNTKSLSIAGGIGESKRLMNFEQFMARIDERFPLRGMERVAVIGAGNSGMNVIEALIGQGPENGWSVASLDRPSQIDWYGVGSTNCNDWVALNRGRYKRIGSAFPKTNRSKSIIRPLPIRAVRVTEGYDGLYVDGKPYSHVIVCIGWERRYFGLLIEEHSVNGYQVGGKDQSRNIYMVGPALDIPFSPNADGAENYTRLQENRVALFRYANRTATLAASLPIK